MSERHSGRLRRLWRNLHLWLGAGLFVLLVPIAISGSLLVWHDHLDALINPGRYAVTAGNVQPPSTYVTAARTAVPANFQAFVVRFPEDAGAPVTVTARETGLERGVRPRLLTVYLDPPNGRVLDVVDPRASFVGFLHRFHENLTIPDYNGRSIVGWVGVAMLVLSLTGIYLWWPRNVAFTRGMRWKRAPTGWSNLHHMIGFWISIPLAVVSLTGIYLGFPQQGRDLLSSVAPMTPQQRGGFGAPLLQNPRLTIDQALDAAIAAQTQAKAAALFAPTQPNPAWRVQLRRADATELTTVLVDDRSGTAAITTPLAGDRTAQWIRWIHEGSHSGVLWQVIVFLCGIAPPVLGVTGIVIWLRQRANRKALARARAEELSQLGAAE
jgi:uncharacterized iron-regulated membrane protein